MTDAKAVLPILARRLRRAASDVRRLSLSIHRSPEGMMIARDQVAADLDQIAAMCEGTPANQDEAS